MEHKKKLLEFRQFLIEKLVYYDSKIKDSRGQKDEDYFTMKFVTYNELLTKLDEL
ncbi:hypothetical protein [Aquimarina algicola]|uniref:hypothetical protein n=1 Tax=Aquimarina algicola TaxID=2589995 RepID=UPI001CF5378F|nr:hypothetical protein [Aquimarina algicola]